MNGIQLAEDYFEAYGRPMLEEKFPGIMPYIAAGLAGSGSECLGFDDAISEDHDFGPGFCLWLPDEETVDRKTAFALERAYNALPQEFKGYKRPLMQPVGGARKGVMRMADFFAERIGRSDADLSYAEWLALPAPSLLEAVNGKVFYDGSGEFSRIRAKLSEMPRDVRLKRLAGHLLLMSQSGQYNYQRCLDHGEEGAAQLAALEFVKNTVSAVFLLNDTYEPYYKWAFRAMRGLPVLSELEGTLADIISKPNDPETSFEKYTRIEEVCTAVIDVLMDLEITSASCGDMEKHAYSVNDHVKDGDLRNMHILAGV